MQEIKLENYMLKYNIGDAFSFWFFVVYKVIMHFYAETKRLCSTGDNLNDRNEVIHSAKWV